MIAIARLLAHFVEIRIAETAHQPRGGRLRHPDAGRQFGCGIGRKVALHLENQLCELPLAERQPVIRLADSVNQRVHGGG